MYKSTVVLHLAEAAHAALTSSQVCLWTTFEVPNPPDTAYSACQSDTLPSTIPTSLEHCHGDVTARFVRRRVPSLHGGVTAKGQRPLRHVSDRRRPATRAQCTLLYPASSPSAATVGKFGRRRQ